MRVWLSVLLAACWFSVIVGCGGSEQITQPATPPQPPTGSSETASATPSNAPAAAASEEPPARFDRKGRRLPTLMVGGGTGGAPATGNPNANPGASNNAPADGDGETEFTATTPENALFPQQPGSGNANAGFGGALFPVSIEGLTDFDLAGSPEAQPEVTLDPSTSSAAGQSDSSTDGLMQQAIELFAELDKENEAMNALYAHVMVNEPVKEKYPIRWYPGLNEPRVAFRWGIGILYSEPSRGFEGRHPVVGDAGDSGSGGGGGGTPVGLEGGQGPPAAGNAASGKYANVDVKRPDGLILYYTGDVGEQLIDRLNKRRVHRDAYYGEILRDIPLVIKNDIASTQPAQATQPNVPFTPIGGGRRNRNLPTLNTGGGGPAQAPINPNQPATPNGSGIEPGGGAGQNASAAGGAPIAPASVLQRARASGASGDPDENTMGTVIPGVMLLGVGGKKELVEKARENGLDALFLITVRVSKSRSGDASSLTNLKVVDIKGERDENLYNGKSLKNTADADDVERMLNGAFEVADAKFKASDLPPNLKPEHVARRVKTILEMDIQNPLPYAVEILDWHMMDMIDDQMAIDALNQLFKDDQMGEALLSPKESDRMKALRPYLRSSRRSADDDL